MKATESELEQFLAAIDSLAEQLRPPRRPQDRNAPECSPQELRALAAIGARNEITMTDLAAAIGVSLSTANHTVGNLVSKGFVVRGRARVDRRVVNVKFSRKGRNIQAYVVKSRRALGRALVERLDLQTRARLLAALEALTNR